MELKRTAVKWMPWLIDIKIIIELPLYLKSLRANRGIFLHYKKYFTILLLDNYLM